MVLGAPTKKQELSVAPFLSSRQSLAEYCADRPEELPWVIQFESNGLCNARAGYNCDAWRSEIVSFSIEDVRPSNEVAKEL